MYYLSITQEQLDSFSKYDSINECIKNFAENVISYYKEIININQPKNLSYNRFKIDCDIICFDSDIELKINDDILKLRIIKPYLICIPLISLLDSNIHLYTFNKNINVYYLFLDSNMSTELRRNPGRFMYIKNYKYQFKTSNIAYNIFPNNTFKLFREYKSNKDNFNSKMQKIANILMNSNLDDKRKTILFLLRHHAVPPDDTVIIPCAYI